MLKREQATRVTADELITRANCHNLRGPNLGERERLIQRTDQRTDVLGEKRRQQFLVDDEGAYSCSHAKALEQFL